MTASMWALILITGVLTILMMVDLARDLRDE
jgi:hypothetical protein